jgi:hypothetical protein
MPLRTWIHPPVDFAPLQSPPASCPPQVSRPRAPSLGLRLPLRDISYPRRCAGVPSPTPSVLGVSHALDGLIRGRPCGFISPHSHVQGSPSRGFPPRTAAPIRHRHVPSRRLATVDYWVAPAPSPAAPPSGLCSVRRSVACAPVLPIAPTRSPPGLLLLQVLTLQTAKERVTVLSPLTTLALRRRPQRLHDPEHDTTLASHADLLEVLACRPGLPQKRRGSLTPCGPLRPPTV